MPRPCDAWLFAPNTPAPPGATVRPNTPHPPGAVAVAVESFRPNTPHFAPEAVAPWTPSPPWLVPATPTPPLLFAPKTPLAFGTVDRPNTPLPPGAIAT